MLPGKGRAIADDHKRDFDKVFAKLADQVSKIVTRPKLQAARSRRAPQGTRAGVSTSQSAAKQGQSYSGDRPS